MIWTPYLDEAGTFGRDADAVSGGVLFRGQVDEHDELHLRAGFLSVYVDGLWPPHRAERDRPAAAVAMAMWPSPLHYLPDVARLAEIGWAQPSLRSAREQGRFPSWEELVAAEDGLRLRSLGVADRELAADGSWEDAITRFVAGRAAGAPSGAWWADEQCAEWLRVLS